MRRRAARAPPDQRPSPPPEALTRALLLGCSLTRTRGSGV